MTCRICGARATAWKGRDDVTLYLCGCCGFVSGQASSYVPADERYEGYYRQPVPPAPAGRYGEWLARAEAEVGSGRLLEVGAGSGGFVRAALARGWKVDATEVSDSGLEMLRETGARVFAGDVEAAQYPEGVFDLVVSLEVLEHLPAPLRHLQELWRITRPGGLLLVTTPNFNGLSRWWLGIQWRVIDAEHLGYFTPITLSEALHQVGYKRVRVKSRSLDVLSWRRGTRVTGGGVFDPHASAELRDTVEASKALRVGKTVVNAFLGLAGVGDSLLAWAQR
jgi:SAM-dependent methyltransferase